MPEERSQHLILSRLRETDFDRVEVLGRLNAVERGERTAYERELEGHVRSLFEQVEILEKKLVAATAGGVLFHSPHGTEWHAETYEGALEMERDALVEQLQSVENELQVVRDNAIRWQNHATTSDREVAALRGHLVAVIAALDLPEIEPSLLWQDSGAAILKRLEEIVDEAERGFRERDGLKEQYQTALAALQGSQGHVPYFGRHTKTIWCERCGPNTPWPCEQTTDEAKRLLSNPAREPKEGEA